MTNVDKGFLIGIGVIALVVGLCFYSRPAPHLPLQSNVPSSVPAEAAFIPDRIYLSNDVAIIEGPTTIFSELPPHIRQTNNLWRIDFHE